MPKPCGGCQVGQGEKWRMWRRCRLPSAGVELTFIALGLISATLMRPHLSAVLTQETFMRTPHDPVQIARHVVASAQRLELPITHMQLQKLVYIAHGFCLAGLGRALISRPVIAWTYGPVIPEIYRAFKHCGGAPICHHTTEPLSPLAQDELDLIYTVTQTYGQFSGVQLSAMTHKVGSPWHATWHQAQGRSGNSEIPNAMIAQTYAAILNGQPPRCL
ncbi:MAG: Panacea domain-containing protein [Aeromonas sp.]